MRKMIAAVRAMGIACAVSVAGAPVFAADISGAGATFPYPIYSKWFSEYQKTHTDVEFNYQSIGSGGGIKQVLAQTVDFGATDAGDDGSVFRGGVGV